MLYEVKEFDKLTSNKSFEGEKGYVVVSERTYNELIKFICDFLASDENDDAFDCLKILKQRNGEFVVIKNYVGLIQLANGDQIQILPKITFERNETEEKINSKTTKVLMDMISSAVDLKNKVLNMSNLNTAKMNIFEIFISMYVKEVSFLVKRGLVSSYMLKEENLNAVKGKINFNKNIRLNYVHKEKVFCEFDEFNINRSENKIIKSTLLLLYKTTKNFDIKKLINQLLVYFELVDESTNFEKDFSEVFIDRTTKSYELILNWSRVFLSGKSFTSFRGESYSRALLFPMEKLFECYVGRFINKVFNDSWSVKLQDRKYYLFDDPKMFALRPDIVLKNKNENCIVMDTKWKALNLNNKKNYGIAQQDMYQMYTYAKKYKTKNIYLIYPINDEVKYIAPFKSYDDVIVNIFFIDLLQVEKSVENLRDIINNYLKI